MKKITALVLTILMMLSLCGCAGGSSEPVDEQLFSGVTPEMSEEEVLNTIGDGYSKTEIDETSYMETKEVRIWGMNWIQQFYITDAKLSMMMLYAEDDLSANSSEINEKLADKILNDLIEEYGEYDYSYTSADMGDPEGEYVDYDWKLDNGYCVSFKYTTDTDMTIYYMESTY